MGERQVIELISRAEALGKSDYVEGIRMLISCFALDEISEQIYNADMQKYEDKVFRHELISAIKQGLDLDVIAAGTIARSLNACKFLSEHCESEGE